MNTQIGKNINHKVSLHNSSNRNGKHLTDFMVENRLTYLNTNFQKREGKLWTYTYTNNSKSQIDYVFIKNLNSNALNCEAYSSFEGVSSDHQIVVAKIWLSLWKNTTRTTNIVHYDWSLLNNRDIRDKYTLTLWNKFDALQKHILRMTNMRISSMPTLKQQLNAYQLNKELNVEAHGRHQQLEKKHADVKTTSKCSRKNSTNTNALKHKKAQNELANIYLKEQTEYIQNQIHKIRDSVEDWQTRIAWQTINKVSRKKEHCEN